MEWNPSLDPSFHAPLNEVGSRYIVMPGRVTEAVPRRRNARPAPGFGFRGAGRSVHDGAHRGCGPPDGVADARL